MLFELNYKDHSFALCDIDPDLHFYQEFNQVTVKCNYCLDTKCNEEISEPKQSTDVLSLCNVNIRSERKYLGATGNTLAKSHILRVVRGTVPRSTIIIQYRCSDLNWLPHKMTPESFENIFKWIQSYLSIFSIESRSCLNISSNNPRLPSNYFQITP